MKRYLLDSWLWAFGIVLLLAAAVSAHGTSIFFRYLMEPWVALLATTLTALGSPS